MNGVTRQGVKGYDIVLFVTVGEIDANGPRGAVGTPAGSKNVVERYPEGVRAN